MKKLTFPPLFSLLSALPTLAQITITNATFPAVGDTLHYAFGNQPGAINQIFTPPGSDQHWNLGSLQANQYWNPAMKNPQTGTAVGAFSGASILYSPPNSSNEAFVKVTGTQIIEMGYFGKDHLGLGLNLLFVNKPGLEESWAPAQFFDLRQSAANVLTAFAAFSAPPILLNLVPTADSFRIRVTYQRISSIDAWGSLTIPGGTFEVLRKKRTEYKSSAVDVKVQPLGWIDISTIGGQQLLPLGTDTITTFHFLNDMSKEPIAVCTLNTQQNMVTGVRYKNTSASSATFAPTANELMLSYPNPVGNTLNVHFSSKAGASVQLLLMDEKGGIALEQALVASAAENDVSLPVAQLPPGHYLLVLRRNGEAVGWAKVLKL